MSQEKQHRPEDIAQLMSVSRRTVYAWIEKGKLQALQMDRAYFIPHSEYCRLCYGLGQRVCETCTYR